MSKEAREGLITKHFEKLVLEIHPKVWRIKHAKLVLIGGRELIREEIASFKQDFGEFKRRFPSALSDIAKIDAAIKVVETYLHKNPRLMNHPIEFFGDLNLQAMELLNDEDHDVIRKKRPLY